ncbi:MAG: hypothetical protein ACRDJE_02320 [Dehalococcoidia bacterium]
MTEPREPAELADMERAASVMAGQIRRLAQITRSLASLTDAIEELRSAAGGLVPADQPPRAERSGPSAPERIQPFVDAAQPGSEEAEAAAPATPDAESHAAAASSPSTRPESLSVTVSCPDGSLDLVRVFRALQPMDGVADLNLLSYTGGRAILQLVVYKPPQQLALHDALAAAFPEGVTGDWIAPTEYVVVIPGTQRRS